MRLGNWDPFYELIQLSDRTDRLLREGMSTRNLSRLEMPAVDIFEEQGKLIVEASLPNFDEKDIEVGLTGDGIEIKAEHSEEKDTKKRKYVLRETTMGGFYRYINLPAGSNLDEAKATFANGILRIDVPLRESASETRSLPINSTSRAK